MDNLFDLKCPVCGNTEDLYVVYEPLNTSVYIGPYLLPEHVKNAQELYRALMTDLWERWIHYGDTWDLREAKDVSDANDPLPSQLTWHFPAICDACGHKGSFSDFDTDRTVRLRRLEKAKEHVHRILKAAAGIE